MFQDELAEKVEEIRRRAFEQYDYWLRNQQITTVSDEGSVGVGTCA